MSHSKARDGNTSNHAAMQLVAEANNAISSGVASAGDWPPKVVWWGTQAFQRDYEEEMSNSGTATDKLVDNMMKGTENAPECRVQQSRRETGLQRSGRQSLIHNSDVAAPANGPDSLNKCGNTIRKPRAKDRLDAGIDALLSRGPPKLLEGTDSIYDRLRDERQHLRLMESTGRGAVMSSSMPTVQNHQHQSTSALGKVYTPPESSLCRSASRGSIGSATLEDRLVQEAFAYAEKLGATGKSVNVANDLSGFGDKVLSRRKSGRRSGRMKNSSAKAGGGNTVVQKKGGVGNRRGNQKTSATKSFHHSPLAQRRNKPRRQGKADFQLRDLRPEPVQNLDTLLEHLQSGDPARMLRMQLSKSKQSLNDSEAFIQLAKESWFS